MCPALPRWSSCGSAVVVWCLHEQPVSCTTFSRHAPCSRSSRQRDVAVNFTFPFDQQLLTIDSSGDCMRHSRIFLEHFPLAYCGNSFARHPRRITSSNTRWECQYSTLKGLRNAISRLKRDIGIPYDFTLMFSMHPNLYSVQSDRRVQCFQLGCQELGQGKMFSPEGWHCYFPNQLGP